MGLPEVIMNAYRTTVLSSSGKHVPHYFLARDNIDAMVYASGASRKSGMNEDVNCTRIGTMVINDQDLLEELVKATSLHNQAIKLGEFCIATVE